MTKDMKMYLKYLITLLLTAFIIFEGIVLGILKFPGSVFQSNYLSLIADKYRILQNTNLPKIIIVSGSSSAFGLNQKMLEEATGYKVANLGLHAGFKPLFYSELAKENINKGDIILLGYEYNWISDDFDSLNPELIMPGIDDNIDMYTHIPINHWKEFVGYIFQYAGKKNSYNPAYGIYSREAFDSNTGQMTMYRKFQMKDYFENQGEYGIIDISNVNISENAINYLKNFKKFTQDIGASVYFISPPTFKKAVVCDWSEFENLRQQEMEKIGIPYISNPVEYFFDDELMCNTIYHCSTKGEKIRTELLIADLKRANIIQ